MHFFNIKNLLFPENIIREITAQLHVQQGLSYPHAEPRPAPADSAREQEKPEATGSSSSNCDLQLGEVSKAEGAVTSRFVGLFLACP